MSAAVMMTLSIGVQDAQAQSRIKRVVEPVSYWVESPKLRIRDNPVAGDVVGLLDKGQKIKGYETLDGWVRISKEGAAERWVNADYVTQNQLTNANYSFNGRMKRPGFGAAQVPDDVTLTRIKAGDAKLFAASIRALPTGNRVIVTRQDFRAGPYFEKRLVSCAGGAPQAYQLLGEGYNYRMMEADPRNDALRNAAPRLPITGGKASFIDVAIAMQACAAP